jgi:hypothetical protein
MGPAKEAAPMWLYSGLFRTNTENKFDLDENEKIARIPAVAAEILHSRQIFY